MVDEELGGVDGTSKLKTVNSAQTKVEGFLHFDLPFDVPSENQNCLVGSVLASSQTSKGRCSRFTW